MLTPGQLVLRGTGLGTLTVLILGGVAWQLLPEDTRADAGTTYYWSGVGVGVLAAALGNVLIAFGAMKESGGPVDSTGFLRAIVMDFALQFGCAAVCILGMSIKGVKFQQVAAFGITFTAAVVVCRMFGTVLVNRALVARSKQRIQSLAQHPQR